MLCLGSCILHLRAFFVDVTHLVWFVRFAVLKIELLLAEEDGYFHCMHGVGKQL